MLLPLGILASAGGAVTADYNLISTQVLTSSVASVTFSSLNSAAAAYKHLQIRWTARSTNASLTDDGNFRINGDSGSNYAIHSLYGNGVSAASVNLTSQTQGAIYDLAAGNNASANIFGSGVLDLLDFQSTSKNKTLRILNGAKTQSNQYIHLSSGLWMSTAAVTSITLAATGNLVAGSRFSIYGLKG